MESTLSSELLKPHLTYETTFFLTNNQWSAIAAGSAFLTLIVTVLGVAIAIKTIKSTYSIHREILEHQKYSSSQLLLLDLSRAWNSHEMVASRVKANHLIKSYRGSLDAFYRVLTANGRIEEWNNISVVAQFLARAGRLLRAGEVPADRARVEFQAAIKYWADTVAALYSNIDDERELCEAVAFLKQALA